jgi:hypothetical protein
MSELERARHESPDVRSRRVLAFALGFVAFAIFLGGGLGLYYRWIVSGAKLTAKLETFPAPQLQPNPAADWENFHKAQVDSLERLGWSDRGKMLVHLPIERAKAIVLARGSQGYDPVEGTPPFVTGTGAPLDGAPRASPEPMAAPYGDVH